MDIKVVLQRVANFLKKYRYVVLILLAGVVLMALPTNREEETTQTESVPIHDEISIEKELETILAQVDGAGEVQVFLTVANGEETVYQTNDSQSRSSDSTSSQTDTVTVSDSKRNELGLIRQINPPIYQGAIVVCKGADSTAVKLSLVDAVSKVTGLSSDKISVLKMK